MGIENEETCQPENPVNCNADAQMLGSAGGPDYDWQGRDARTMGLAHAISYFGQIERGTGVTYPPHEILTYAIAFGQYINGETVSAPGSTDEA